MKTLFILFAMIKWYFSILKLQLYVNYYNFRYKRKGHF